MLVNLSIVNRRLQGSSYKFLENLISEEHLVQSSVFVNTFCLSDSASLVVCQCHLCNKDFYMIYSVR